MQCNFQIFPIFVLFLIDSEDKSFDLSDICNQNKRNDYEINTLYYI